MDRYINQQLAIYRLVSLFWLIAPILLVYLCAVFPGVGLVWDGANALGFSSAGLFLYLFIETGRPRVKPKFEGKFFLHLHRDIAILVLVLATVHGLALLIKEPVSIEYLKLSAPFHMLAGIVAWFLLIYLTFSSFKKIRVKLFHNHKSYRIIHGVTAVVCLYLIWFHVVESHFYFSSYFSEIISAVLVILLLLYYAVNRDSNSHTVFAQYVKKIIRKCRKLFSVFTSKKISYEYRIKTASEFVLPMIVLIGLAAILWAVVFSILQNVEFFEK